MWGLIRCKSSPKAMASTEHEPSHENLLPSTRDSMVLCFVNTPSVSLPALNLFLYGEDDSTVFTCWPCSKLRVRVTGAFEVPVDKPSHSSERSQLDTNNQILWAWQFSLGFSTEKEKEEPLSFTRTLCCHSNRIPHSRLNGVEFVRSQCTNCIF